MQRQLYKSPIAAKTLVLTALVTAFIGGIEPTQSLEPDQYKTSPSKESLDQVVDNIMTPYVRRNAFAGVVLVADGPQTAHSKAYGEVIPGEGIQHQVNSEWRWASVTKMVAGLLVMQEIEGGRLSLDQVVSSLLPQAPDHFKTVTLRQLMNHTSGLANPDQTEIDSTTGVYEWASASIPNFAYCYGPPLAEAGSRFDYNACDFIVLADILKTITGQDFQSLVKTRITERYSLDSIKVVNDVQDDAEIVGTKRGKPVNDGLKLANLSADAAIVGKPTDLLKLTQLFMADEIITDAVLKREFGRGIPEFGQVALTVWGYRATLTGCKEPVDIIERQGHLPGTKILTLQAPDLRRSIVLFSNREETDWGWIWQEYGLSYTLASEVFCRPKTYS